MGHGRLLRLLSILHAISIFDRVDLLRVAEHTVLATKHSKWSTTSSKTGRQPVLVSLYGTASPLESLIKCGRLRRRKTLIQRKLLEIMNEKLRWKRYVSRP